MKRLRLVGMAAICLGGGALLASDHNNLDGGRPLRFDDAESISFRELAFEGGLGYRSWRGLPAGGVGEFSLLYGFARNSQVALSLVPVSGGRLESDRRGLGLSNASISALHTFNREYGEVPAFAVRADLTTPTEGERSGMEGRLRGIMSKSFGYNRVHVNVDLEFASPSYDQERRAVPGIILGYSRPLGYPGSFDRTFLMEVGVKASPLKSGRSIRFAGLGLRQQITPRGVLDVGLMADLRVPEGLPKERFRAIAGYSVAF